MMLHEYVYIGNLKFNVYDPVDRFILDILTMMQTNPPVIYLNEKEIDNIIKGFYEKN